MSRKSALQTFVETSWENFNGQFGLASDGKQDCKVLLFYSSNPSTGYHVIEGKTGQGSGHAEMHALTQFLNSINLNTFDTYDIRIDCTAKPCCARCSIVMGFLGIKVANQGTKKSNKCMGGTQWSVNARVRELMELKGIKAVFQEFENINNQYVNGCL